MTAPLVISRLPAKERAAMLERASDAADLVAAVCLDLDALGQEDERLERALALIGSVRDALR